MIGLSAIPLTAISKSFCSGSRCKKLAVIYLLKSGSISIGANLTRKLSSHPGATYPFFGKILYGPAFKIPEAELVILKLKFKLIREVFLMVNL